MIGLSASAALEKLRGNAAQAATQPARRNKHRLVIISRYYLP
jgi:hypothetical protein